MLPSNNNNDFPNDNCKLQIICPDAADEAGDESSHPHCAHGPTLRFEKHCAGVVKQSYYGCAAHRDRRVCSFHLDAQQLNSEHLLRRYEQPTQQYRAMAKQFMRSAAAGKNCHYCLSCNVALIDAQQQHSNHQILRNMTSEQLKNPTEFLPPLQNDKVQAQYFFDEKALKFFAKCLKDLGINKIVCMGAPRLHGYLRQKCSQQFQSFLLDFDHRFYYFYRDAEFAWYNMCNNYFFDKQQQQHFERFLKKSSADSRLLIFTDPPFGCRTEPIANTLRQMTLLHNRLNALPLNEPLPIFWIFPYFSEHYIQQQMPALQMCDYKINYTNHDSYTDTGDKFRKYGSPVRLFTNVDLQRLVLPVEEQYKYCKQCQRYTALENRHCHRCGKCPSKNGSTYRHCEQCGMCVKPSYVHCPHCRRCTQRAEHNCAIYQQHQKCWICQQLGHTEQKCAAWLAICKRRIDLPKIAKRTKITCCICGKVGQHNEQNCAKRAEFIDEQTFMGQTELTFRI